VQKIFLAGLVLVGVLGFTSDVKAGPWRKMMGGHPYHNGYYFIPPSSAYEAVTLRPPIRYGAPAYYYPESYLAPAPAVYMVPVTWYPGVPAWRAGGYYMSGAGPAYFYPW
jgi:hypothetical protein